MRHLLPPCAADAPALLDASRWRLSAGPNRSDADHIIDLVVDHDLVLGLLQLHHLAELVRLAGLTFANDLRRWLEQAEEFAFGVCVTAEDTRSRLLHHLLDQRYHRVELLAQTFERQLLQDVPRALRSSGDLFGESLRLSHHSAGRVEQLAIGSIEPLPALLGSGARSPGDVQDPQLHAATAVAQLGASFAGDLANPFHRADQNSHAIAQQARIGRIVDVGLHHGGVHAHSAPRRQPVGLGQLHQPLVNLLDHLASHRHAPTSHRLCIRRLAGANTLLFPTFHDTVMTLFDRVKDGIIPMRAWTSLKV